MDLWKASAKLLYFLENHFRRLDTLFTN